MRQTDSRQCRTFGKTIGIGMLVLLLLCLTGCASKKGPVVLKEGQYYTYYVNQEGTSLVSRVYEAESEDTAGLLAELLEQCQTVPEGVDGRRLIPANVVLSESIALSDGVANVYFDTTYTLMDQVTELLCKAGLAKTLTQVNEVAYISIYVNGEPYHGQDATYTGPVLLSASDFVDNTGDDTNKYTQADLVLYFANESGTALVTEIRSVVYSSGLSLERVILNQLIAGPREDGNTATLPAALKVQGISLRDGVCYIDCDQSFLETPMNVSDAVEIYSLVNTMTELETIRQVQITVNGSSDKLFRNHISLADKFSRDISYFE